MIIVLLGAKVTVPMDDSENKMLTRLAEEYYVTCDAEAQSGKTVGVGILPDKVIKGRWVVSYLNNLLIFAQVVTLLYISNN